MRSSLTFLCGTAAALQMGPVVRAPRASVAMSAQSGEEVLLAKFGMPAEQFQTDRRSALGLGFAAVAALGSASPAMAEDAMFKLPPLPYAYVRASRAARAELTALCACSAASALLQASHTIAHPSRPYVHRTRSSPTSMRPP